MTGQLDEPNLNPASIRPLARGLTSSSLSSLACDKPTRPRYRPCRPGDFYRDSTGAIKREAQRFRLFGYNAAGAHLAELGRVLFVGDGSNDAAAMAESEVSIAVGGGSPLPREVARLVWHGRRLATIPWAIARARATCQVIRSNLMLAAAYNIIGLSAAAAGLLHPILAALLMLGSSLTVIGRTLAASKLGA